ALRELRLHQTNQPIPHLREVLALVDSRVPLVVELKTTTRYKQLCHNTWRILRLYDGDICIESFDPRIVRWFKKNVPGVLRGQLAAPPRILNQGVRGYAVGLLFSNFLARPHFIAYQKGGKPFTVRLVERFSMCFVWTVRPEDALSLLQDENDTIIFEFFEPEPYYKDLPDILLTDEEYRF
ncbi:MAG: hypothetical protein ACRCWR_09245, partial [Saezia sp.]